MLIGDILPDTPQCLRTWQEEEDDDDEKELDSFTNDLGLDLLCVKVRDRER